MLSTQERCALLTVGECNTGKDCGHISGAARATPPHEGLRYAGPGAPGTRGHGGGCLGTSPVPPPAGGSKLVCVWQGYRVFQLAAVQGVMPRSVSAAGSWCLVSVVIAPGGWLGCALLGPCHATQVAASSLTRQPPASQHRPLPPLPPCWPPFCVITNNLLDRPLSYLITRIRIAQSHQLCHSKIPHCIFNFTFQSNLQHQTSSWNFFMTTIFCSVHNFVYCPLVSG